MVASERDDVANRLRGMLYDAPDLLVLGPSAIPEAALFGTVEIYRPEVLLLGQQVLRTMGDRAIGQLVDLPSRPRVLLVCGAPEPPRVAVTVLQHRLYGYVSERDEATVLLNAVRCVARGELWVPRLTLSEDLDGTARTRRARDERELP